jgi:hypothetical protein
MLLLSLLGAERRAARLWRGRLHAKSAPCRCSQTAEVAGAGGKCPAACVAAVSRSAAHRTEAAGAAMVGDR